MERQNKVERHTFVSYFIHTIWWTVRYLVVLKVMHMYVLMLNMLSSKDCSYLSTNTVFSSNHVYLLVVLHHKSIKDFQHFAQAFPFKNSKILFFRGTP